MGIICSFVDVFFKTNFVIDFFMKNIVNLGKNMYLCELL